MNFRHPITVLLALSLVLAACSDDTSNGDDDTSDGMVDTADMTADEADDQDMDAADGDSDQDADDDGSDATDVEEDMGMTMCTPPMDPDTTTATYDAFTTLGFVGVAEVTKTGLDVVVDVEGEMFSGEFDPDSSCVPPQAGLLFPLCFLTPDGFPAEPETLGAMLVTGANDTIGIVAAHRRGVDRSCAFSGAYALTASNTTVEPMDTDQMLVDEFITNYGEYFMIFELPEQTVAVLGRDSPRIVNPFEINANRDGFADFTFEQGLDPDNLDDWQVTATATNGTLSGDTVTFDLQLDVVGLDANPGVEFTITTSLTGTVQ